jgi:hypothetical protein
MTNPMEVNDFFEQAWNQYVEITPDAPRIQKLLIERGENWMNDHVAFRTFNLPGISRADLGKVFEQWGYRKADEELNFPEKKLKANYYLHLNPNLPKVFISELLVEQVSPPLREWIVKTTQSATRKIFTAESFLASTWEPPQLTDYQAFYKESEYAAWTLAFGIRANHFTVLVNSLSTFNGSLQELNEFLILNHFQLNSSGGQIKGTPQEFLEQSSTLAQYVPWKFSGGVSGGVSEGVIESIMGCYYEFAKRYTMPGTSELFTGFIPKSADKIFESTFEKSH